MTECHFPILKYDLSKSSFEQGREHGEKFSKAIAELAQIRKKLMLNKNPKLKNHLSKLAQEQADATRAYDEELYQEMLGIAKGSKLELEDIIILNNYTDFRDISLEEEGCSTVSFKLEDAIFSGQTWDMHRSAMNYMCVLHLGDTIILSLVGCLALMGYNSKKLMIGVNNVNTKNASPGIAWPALVRKALRAQSFSKLRDHLKSAKVTSGHSYLITGPQDSEIWEVSPSEQEKVATLSGARPFIFHTNHCLGPVHKELESKLAANSTTFDRFNELEQALPKVETYESFRNLFDSHQNFPKSICSHFESGAQDPSFTCGGGSSDFSTNFVEFWRGCRTHSSNYKSYTFELKQGQYELTKN